MFVITVTVPDPQDESFDMLSGVYGPYEDGADATAAIEHATYYRDDSGWEWTLGGQRAHIHQLDPLEPTDDTLVTARLTTRMLREIDTRRGGKSREGWVKEAIVFHLELAAKNERTEEEIRERGVIPRHEKHWP